MVSVAIVVEGGGRGELHAAAFKRGWGAFFRRAGVSSISVVRGGARERAFDLFKRLVATRDGLVVLLVDSESAVEPGQTPWGHLKARDGWDRPAAADQDSAYLMVQTTETWLIADREALARHFGRGFRDSALPTRANLEDVPKAEAEAKLKAATRDCPAPFEKRHAWEILAMLDASRVEAACPHAKHLLERLRTG
ncbi:MAG: DUF4276 family protein [Dehalococcoidia bacterium]